MAYNAIQILDKDMRREYDIYLESKLWIFRDRDHSRRVDTTRKGSDPYTNSNSLGQCLLV